jgi:hypothetical protein
MLLKEILASRVAMVQRGYEPALFIFNRAAADKLTSEIIHMIVKDEKAAPDSDTLWGIPIVVNEAFFKGGPDGPQFFLLPPECAMDAIGMVK